MGGFEKTDWSLPFTSNSLSYSGLGTIFKPGTVSLLISGLGGVESTGTAATRVEAIAQIKTRDFIMSNLTIFLCVFRISILKLEVL